MFSLVNGKPRFYIGKINGIGYTSKEEKEDIIKELKEENPDAEIKDELVKVDKDLKQKAIKLGKLKLTYSKTEFLQYLNGEKTCSELEVRKLKEENQNLQKELILSNIEILNTVNAVNEETRMNQAQLMIEIARTLEELKGGE